MLRFTTKASGTAGKRPSRSGCAASRSAYRPRYQLQRVEADKDRTIVTFEVSGTFPGSPAVLRQAFTFDSHQRIATLETL